MHIEGLVNNDELTRRDYPTDHVSFFSRFNDMSPAGKAEMLKDWLDKGAITQEEYAHLMAAGEE